MSTFFSRTPSWHLWERFKLFISFSVVLDVLEWMEDVDVDADADE